VKRILLLGIAASLFSALTAACGEDPAPTVSAVVSPDTFVSGSTVTVTVTTTHFEIRDPAGTSHQHLRVQAGDHEEHEESVANAGHYHVYLDSTEVNPLGMGSASTLDVVVDSTPGAHKLIIRLNDDSHAFLKPEVKAEVPITVTVQ
jgi:hypothetical protein